MNICKEKYSSYVVVKKFDSVGCVAIAVPNKKIYELSAFLETYLDDGNTQVVITNNPEVYTEYAPYDIKTNLKEFLNAVLPN